MAVKKVEGPELKKLVKMGKKRRLNFAFCPDAKGNHVLVIDKITKPKPLSQAAKAESPGTRVAYGTYVLNEKTLELTCEKTVPVMAKVLKKYLKSQKTNVNVVIMDENGNVLESDIEDLPAEDGWDDDDGDTDDAADGNDVAAEGAENQNEDQKIDASGIDKAELVKRIQALQPGIGAAPAAVAGKLNDGVKKAIGEIKKDALDVAQGIIEKIEAAVAKLADMKPAETAAAKAAPEPAAEEANEEAKQAPAADLRALAARANGLRDIIAGIEGPAREKLVAALKEAAAKIRAADLGGADSLLGRIEAAVNKTMAAVAQAEQATEKQAADGQPDDDAGQPETAQQAKAPDQGADPEQASDDDDKKDAEPAAGAKEWAAAEARLQPQVDQLMDDKRGDLAGINRAFNFAKGQAKAGKFESALKAASRAEELVRAAADATTTSAAKEALESIPDDVVPYVKSRLAWIGTRKALHQQISGLKNAVDRVASGVEGMEKIGSASGVLFDYLGDIDSGLEVTLERLVETPDGPAREALKSDARDIIADYHDLLETDFFKNVDNNGFVQTDIRSAALASLKDVSAALGR